MAAGARLDAPRADRAGAGGRTVAEALAAQALAFDLSAAPGGAVEKAKLCLLDFLSCAFEARAHPWSVQAAALACPAPDGATIIGSAGRFAAADAAFANGVLGHGLVREDMHAGSIAHLGVVVWPTLLALVHRRRTDGRALLAAAVVGYEAGGRLGRALVSTEVAQLFRPTGLVGPPAASLAASRLLGLDEARTTAAFALAANTCAGLNEWPSCGGSEMYFHPGFAARNALTAVRLAEQGAFASPTIVEGAAGLFAAYGRTRPTGDITLFADDRPEILAVFNKPVPACNFAQSPCQAALEAARALGGRGRIARVEVETSEVAVRYPGCDSKGPFRNALQAKMSIQFGVAAALVRGSVAEENYQGRDDPEIMRLVEATELRSERGFTDSFPAQQGARVTLVLEDGDRISRALDDVVFATPEDVRRRFDAAAREAVGGRAQEIAERITGLEAERDVAGLASLCAAAADGNGAGR